MEKIKTRFAPSPTGFLHIGGLRTALYSYAYAKSLNGQFVLRIEDTDQKRYVRGAVEKIYEMLEIFGLKWDEGPYLQSQRAKEGIYEKYARQLVSQGNAYYCFCDIAKKEKKDNLQERNELRDNDCRNLTNEEIENKLKSGIKPAIRLRVPDNQIIKYHDFVVNKDISWNTDDVDEAMLLKSDNFPTYHLAVTVDDHLMGISHILRGHDWMPSTPIHLLLYQYLKFSLPEIGHLTDILDPEGGKLSKRKGSVSCEEMIEEGYLPEAILNFIMLLGWAPKNNQETFSLQEFVDNFQKGSLQIANPIFNRKKLDWFNGYYLRQKSDSEIAMMLKKYAPKGADFSLINKTVPLVKDRIAKLSDYSDFAEFFFKEPQIDRELIPIINISYLEKSLAVLKIIDQWTKEEIEIKLKELIKRENWPTGDFFMSFRIALTGSKFTPPITDSAVILGKNITLERINRNILLK